MWISPSIAGFSKNTFSIEREVRDSENDPDDWFWALTAISEQNPIPKEAAGDMTVMTEAWLQWGRNAGYLSDCPKQPSEPSANLMRNHP